MSYENADGAESEKSDVPITHVPIFQKQTQVFPLKVKFGASQPPTPPVLCIFSSIT